MFLKAVNLAAELIGERIVEKNAPMPATPKAQFNLRHNGELIECEECGGTKFNKLNKSKARCAREWCGVVYNVEYSVLDLDIIFYEG